MMMFFFHVVLTETKTDIQNHNKKKLHFLLSINQKTKTFTIEETTIVVDSVVPDNEYKLEEEKSKALYVYWSSVMI